MTITINGKQYKFKRTMRALFLFEELTGKPFEIKSLFDNYLFFYCVILANNPDNVLDFDEYIDALDNDPDIYTQLMELLEQSQRVEKMAAPIADDGTEKKR